MSYIVSTSLSLVTTNISHIHIYKNPGHNRHPTIFPPVSSHFLARIHTHIYMYGYTQSKIKKAILYLLSHFWKNKKTLLSFLFHTKRRKEKQVTNLTILPKEIFFFFFGHFSRSKTKNVSNLFFFFLCIHIYIYIYTEWAMTTTKHLGIFAHKVPPHTRRDPSPHRDLQTSIDPGTHVHRGVYMHARPSHIRPIYSSSYVYFYTFVAIRWRSDRSSFIPPNVWQKKKKFNDNRLEATTSHKIFKTVDLLCLRVCVACFISVIVQWL